MLLGTPRHWWIAAAVPLVLGFALVLTGGSTLRTAAGVLLLLLAMVLFGMAPMRYGQTARTPPPSATDTPPTSHSTTIDAPESRPVIPGRDPSEV
jgi:drug/metabolite transporter (DMT)-like permease